MKRIIQIMSISLGISSQTFFAQSQINFGDFTRPVPSVSSMASYINSGESTATGMPDISVPLVQLPTANSSVPLNLSLSYSALNVSADEAASQVGTGWSLFSGGVISRSIVQDIDELYDDPNQNIYYKNNFDDIYYYNIPGASGKFKFVRNTAANTFDIVNLTSNKLTFEYTRTVNSATLIINSFVITDAKGIKYYFNDYSLSHQHSDMANLGSKIYRSAFFLTQIVDSNNLQIASFSYQKDIKYQQFIPNMISYQTCKLKTVTSPRFGKIEFEYLYEPSMENTYNDPYQVQKVVLKDHYNHLISQYAFEYSFFPYNYSPETSVGDNSMFKRVLNKIRKSDRNNVVTEVTTFEYANAPEGIYQPGINSGNSCPVLGAPASPLGYRGILKKVTTPSGGVIEYNFETGDYFKDRTDPSYVNTILANENFIDGEVQYYAAFHHIGFDTHQTTTYSFTISGMSTRRIFIIMGADVLYPLPETWETDATPYVDYIIRMHDQTPVYGTACGSGGLSSREFMLEPGTYTLQISGSGGNGMVSFFGLNHVPQPFKNYSKGGIRIGSIKYYGASTDMVPVKTTRFEYKSFQDANTSSGYQVDAENDPNALPQIIYKNVKVTNGDDHNGYVKYYYKIPDDYPKEPYVAEGLNTTFSPYYNLTGSGLLDKKEMFDSQNKLLLSEKTDYAFDYVPGSTDFHLNSGGYSRLGWLKKISNTSTTYFDNGQSIQEQSETNFSVFNFEMASSKKTADGNIIEQFVTYPETGYPQLAAAHILSNPVKVEEKNDGKTVSKAETRYDNTSSTLPTSVLAYNVQDNSTKLAKKIDQYDSKGNVIQFTSQAGIPTAIVYGYDQTVPIARIEGAVYTQVSSLIQPIIDASNADAQNPLNEAALINELENFRRSEPLKSFQVSTYTYDPLIGVTTTISTNGLKEFYHYNNSNQLEKVTDANGIVLKEYKYNYKN